VSNQWNGDQTPPYPRPGQSTAPNAAQWAVAGVAVALAVGWALYQVLHEGRLEQTAALYIGLPAVLAVILALTPRARSARGMAVKGTTIGLLLSGVFLGEGLVCIVMAAPLFLLVAFLIGFAIDRSRRDHGLARVWLAVPLLLTLTSLEGVTPATTLDRDEAVTVTREVAASPAEVEAALAATPRFDTERPWLLRLGFPRPLATAGSGLADGDTRVVVLSSHARHFGHSSGTLVLAVAGRSPGRVVFEVADDTTPIASWVRWQRSEVTWAEVAPGRTRVSWTLRYRRLLDPAWYFGPLEKAANQQGAGYLIDNLATPR
jgi:hypothetical protein